MTANDGAAVHAVKPVFDTLAVAQHDGVFARLDFRHVHADRSGADPEVGAAAGQMRGLCAGHQCLGRDASGVDAGAADQLALHHGNGVAGRGQPPCQRGPGLAGTHHDRVETLCHRAAVTAASANPPPHRDSILEQGGRQVAAERPGQAGARLVAAQGAEHGADDARTQRAPGEAPGGADDGAREPARQRSGRPNDGGAVRRRCLGKFVEDEFTDAPER